MKVKQNRTAGMVDISMKKITKRLALASCQITMNKKAFEALYKEIAPKGDVLETARIAGIMAAKSTPNIIPLCHPLALNKVEIRFYKNQKKRTVLIETEVTCRGRTGVEMEVLTATSVAALTIYDMLKFCDKTMVISDLKLLFKQGGKSGDFKRKTQ